MGDNRSLYGKALCMFFLLSPCVPEREAGVEKRSDVIRVSPKDVVDNRRLLEKRTPRDFYRAYWFFE